MSHSRARISSQESLSILETVTHVVWRPAGVCARATPMERGYDLVLRGRLPPGLSVICYADDTLVIARGRTFKRQRALPPGVSLVVGRIAALGLWEALDKRQALLFHGPVGVRPLAHPSWSTRSSYQFGPKLSIWA